MFRTNFHPIYLTLNNGENRLNVFTILRDVWSILARANTNHVHVYDATLILRFRIILKAVAHLSCSKPDVVNKLVWVRRWAIKV